MKKNSIRKLTIAGVLVAVAVVGSLFSIPVLGAKCSPVQHMVNVLCLDRGTHLAWALQQH